MAATPLRLAEFNRYWDLGWRFLPPILGYPGLVYGAFNVLAWPVLGLLGWLLYGTLAYLFARLARWERHPQRDPRRRRPGRPPSGSSAGSSSFPFLQSGAAIATWQLICRYKALRSVHGLSWQRTALGYRPAVRRLSRALDHRYRHRACAAPCRAGEVDMTRWIRLFRGALLLDTASFVRFRNRGDVFMHGVLIVTVVALLAALPTFIGDAVGALAAQPGAVNPRSPFEDMERGLEQAAPALSGVPVQATEEIVGQMRQIAEAAQEIASRSAALPTALPRPLGGVLRALGDWLSHPFEGSLLPLFAATLGTWLGYGIWVMLAARLLGGRSDMAGFFGTTSLYSLPHVLNIFAFVPVLGPLLAFVAFIWGLVIYVKATATTHELSLGRAILAVALTVLAAGCPADRGLVCSARADFPPGRTDDGGVRDGNDRILEAPHGRRGLGRFPGRLYPHRRRRRNRRGGRPRSHPRTGCQGAPRPARLRAQHRRWLCRARRRYLWRQLPVCPPIST